MDLLADLEDSAGGLRDGAAVAEGGAGGDVFEEDEAVLRELAEEGFVVEETGAQHPFHTSSKVPLRLVLHLHPLVAFPTPPALSILPTPSLLPSPSLGRGVWLPILAFAAGVASGPIAPPGSRGVAGGCVAVRHWRRRVAA
eukprot:3175764-Pyramimonas_sp.AAC.1